MIHSRQDLLSLASLCESTDGLGRGTVPSAGLSFQLPRKLTMKRVSVIVAALALVIGLAWTLTAMAWSTAKTSGCSCVKCACPDCNGEFCTCETCECEGCGCLANAAPKRTHQTAATKPTCCLAKKTAARSKLCLCEGCECPDCIGEFCTCETCECSK